MFDVLFCVENARHEDTAGGAAVQNDVIALCNTSESWCQFFTFATDIRHVDQVAASGLERFNYPLRCDLVILGNKIVDFLQILTSPIGKL